MVASDCYAACHKASNLYSRCLHESIRWLALATAASLAGWMLWTWGPGGQPDPVPVVDQSGSGIEQPTMSGAMQSPVDVPGAAEAGSPVVFYEGAEDASLLVATVTDSPGFTIVSAFSPRVAVSDETSE